MTVQRERPHEIMRRFTLRPFHSRWQPNRPGYNLYVEDRKPFGHVKYNIAGDHPDHFTIYAYQYRPEDDPRGLFNANANPQSRYMGMCGLTTNLEFSTFSGF